MNNIKKLPLLSSSLYLRPWCLSGSAHSELGSLYANYLNGSIATPDLKSSSLANTFDLSMVDFNVEDSGSVSSGISYDFDAMSGLAVVTISGIVCKRVPDIHCGPQLVDLYVLDTILKSCLYSDSVRNVLLYCNSPGGSALGLMETSSVIEDLKEAGKQVIAYTDVQCCSAAYWLAASCSSIYAAPSAHVGSINAYIAALDDSRAWEMAGMELKLFAGGDLKAMGHSGKEWTVEEEDYLNEQVASCRDMFHAHVYSNRPGISSSSMRGNSFSAYDAPEGVIDGVVESVENMVGLLM